MELYQLKSFLVAAEEGNLTRAARRLNTSQPSISAHIKALEDEFGITLFERTRGGMLLTGIGERLHEKAQAIVAGAGELESLARDLSGEVAGSLRIGVNNQGFGLRLDAICRELVERYPGLQLAFEYANTGSLTARLQDGRLDLAFVEGDFGKELDTRLLKRVEVVVVTPLDWREGVSAGGWQELVRRPWVFVSEDCSYYGLFREIQKEHRATLRSQFKNDDSRSILEFVEGGLAASFMDRQRVIAEGFADRLYIWPGFSRLSPLSLAAPRGRLADKAAAAFVEAAQRIHECAESA